MQKATKACENVYYQARMKAAVYNDRMSSREGAAEIVCIERTRLVKEFKSGKLSLGVDDISRTAAEDLTGATIDDNGVLISASEDGGSPVAIGFRAKKANGKYRYFWLYKVKFGISATNLETKGDSIKFSTPSIEGTVMRRNKLVYTGLRANLYSNALRRIRNMDTDRSTAIQIGCEEYQFVLTTRATKEIAKRYGGLENLGEKLMKSENFEMALDEVVWLIVLLANQSVLIHNLQNQEKRELSPKK